MAYFKNLPNIIYPTQQSGKNSGNDYTKIKNLFKRPFIPESILKIYSAFEDYQIIGNDRPDNVSQKYYNNATYDWLIFIANNIQNVQDEWPLSQSDLNNFLFSKYTEQELSEIHHYETTEVKNSFGSVILKGGIKVKSNYTLKYTETVGGNILVRTVSPVKPVSNYEYELQLNDDKRSIVLIRPEYISLIERELNQIFRYKPSSLFVDEFNIKVNDQCIPKI